MNSWGALFFPSEENKFKGENVVKLFFSTVVFLWVMTTKCSSAYAQHLPRAPLVPSNIQKIVISVRASTESASAPVIGSGYLTSTDRWTYMVTARHVLEPMIGKTIQIGWLSDQDQQISFAVEVSTTYVDNSIFFSPRDIAAVRIGQFLGDGRARIPENLRLLSTSLKPNGGLTVISKNYVLGLDEIEPTEETILGGFPVSINNYLEAPAQSYDDSTPLFRRGIISGINHQKHFILIDTMVLPGNSGGPVLVTRKMAAGTIFYLAGIAIQSVPSISVSKNERGMLTNVELQNAAYAVVEPADGITSLLQRADALAGF